MASNRAKSEFTHIAPVLKGLLKECRVYGGGELARILQVWERTVDPGIRENARPAAIRKGALLIHVTSSPWLHQLQFLKTGILARLNAELTTIELNELIFKIGPL